jgi:hypothetical protein
MDFTLIAYWKGLASAPFLHADPTLSLAPAVVRRSNHSRIAQCANAEKIVTLWQSVPLFDSASSGMRLTNDVQCWRVSHSELLDRILSLPKTSEEISTGRFPIVDGKTEIQAGAADFTIDNK